MQVLLDCVRCLFNTEACFLSSQLLSHGEKTTCTAEGESSLTPAVTVKTILSNTIGSVAVLKDCFGTWRNNEV